MACVSYVEPENEVRRRSQGRRTEHNLWRGDHTGRSNLVRAAMEKLPHRIFLFCTNRGPEDAAFLDELNALQTKDPNFRMIATIEHLPD